MDWLEIYEGIKSFVAIVPKNFASQVDATVFLKSKCRKQKTIE